MRQRLAVVTVGLAALLGVFAATGIADPDLANVAPHRHWIGDVQVGPRVCDNPNLQQAHNQFHTNVHRGAPGLHNGQGGEIRSSGC